MCCTEVIEELVATQFDNKSSKASFAFPILPQAFILGATPNDIVFESILLYP